MVGILSIQNIIINFADVLFVFWGKEMVLKLFASVQRESPIPRASAHLPPSIFLIIASPYFSLFFTQSHYLLFFFYFSHYV